MQVSPALSVKKNCTTKPATVQTQDKRSANTACVLNSN